MSSGMCCITNGINSGHSEEHSKQREQKRKDKQITHQLRLEKAKYIRTHRLLLLGAGESGKSTIVKQMELVFLNGFSDEYKLEFAEIIRRNLLDSVQTILNVMPKFSITLSDRNLEAHKEYILTITPNGSHLPPRFYDSCRKIALDPAILKCLKRNNEYQSLDSASYFLEPNKICEIARENYTPTDMDILRSRKKTEGIFETKFEMEGESFHIFDVGGQREERKKWIQCFNDVTAIIFVVESSGYDCVIRENDETNRLEESLRLFESIWKNHWLKNISIILFLNKQDVLELKIIQGRKMEPYFPAIEAYAPPDDTEIPPGREDYDPRFHTARWFIREQFVRISAFSANNDVRRLYPHFTTAIDTDNIRNVFGDCKRIVNRINLRDFHMLS